MKKGKAVGKHLAIYDKVCKGIDIVFSPASFKETGSKLNGRIDNHT